MRSPRVRLLRAIYRAALRVLPRPLRRTHAAEMTAVFERLVLDARARSGVTGALARAGREIGDVVLTGLRGRARALRSVPRAAYAAPAAREVASSLGARIMQGLMQDLRVGVRSWVRRPVFAAGAILVLALGIGASVSLFSVLDAAMLRPLPYRDAGALHAVWQRPPQNASGRGRPCRSRCSWTGGATHPASRLLPASWVAISRS